MTDKEKIIVYIDKLLEKYPKNYYLLTVAEFIDSLQEEPVELKGVDLEKEIKEEYLKRRCYGGRDNMLVILNEPQFNNIAKHFFELGLKTKKGE